MTFGNRIGRVMPHDCLLSAYAGGSMLGAALERWQAPPGFVEWEGEAKSGGHPSWEPVAQRLRGPDGRLLPNLLGRFYSGLPARLGVIGFSAGSNSGLREILKHPLDRAMVSFCTSLDGIHAALKPESQWSMTDPRSAYVAWDAQMAPIAEYALQAARGNGLCVITGNNLSELTDKHPYEYKPGLARTPFSMSRIFMFVRMMLDSEVSHTPLNEGLLKEFLELPAPAYTLNYLSGSAKRAAERILARGLPRPKTATGFGNYFTLDYSKTQASDHIDQANTVLVNIIDSFVKTYWGIKFKDEGQA